MSVIARIEKRPLLCGLEADVVNNHVQLVMAKPSVSCHEIYCGNHIAFVPWVGDGADTPTKQPAPVQSQARLPQKPIDPEALKFLYKTKQTRSVPKSVPESVKKVAYVELTDSAKKTSWWETFT